MPKIDIEYLDDRRRDRVAHVNPEGITIVLTGAYFQCTYCDRIRPVSKFGLRWVAKGSQRGFRNQPRCVGCRHKQSEEAA